MTNLPRLYPGHQHRWVDAEYAVNEQFTHTLVRCTVCGFQAPRNAAGLDGQWRRLHIAWEDSPPPLPPAQEPLARQAADERREMEAIRRLAEPLFDQPDQPEQEQPA